MQVKSQPGGIERRDVDPIGEFDESRNLEGLRQGVRKGWVADKERCFRDDAGKLLEVGRLEIGAGDVAFLGHILLNADEDESFRRDVP